MNIHKGNLMLGVAALSAFAAIGPGGGTAPQDRSFGLPASPEDRERKSAERLARKSRLVAKAEAKRQRKALNRALRRAS